MASVSIQDLRKRYGPTEVLHGVSFTIEDGDFVTLVGPSGCGKSTLLRMVAGLEDVSGGAIRIADEVVNDVPPKDRNIAMVFQSYALYPHMTVAGNMGFALRLARTAKDKIRERVGRAAGILGLEPLLQRQPKQLSGGQRQRVAMGRAIVRDPKVFLFDEPLSNLDAKLRVKMRTEIKELHQRLKTTTIYVTHDQIEAMTMADKIVVMRDGIIEQMGGPLELYDNPRNLFVAGFIGSPAMNFIEGILSEGSFRTKGGFLLALPMRHKGPVILGLRPEDLPLAEGEGEGTLAATIRVVEPTGPEQQLIVDVEGNEVVSVLRGREVFRPGQTVRFAVDPAKAHVFDAASGQRVH